MLWTERRTDTCVSYVSEITDLLFQISIFPFYLIQSGAQRHGYIPDSSNSDRNLSRSSFCRYPDCVVVYMFILWEAIKYLKWNGFNRWVADDKTYSYNRIIKSMFLSKRLIICNGASFL